jgi:hypothetical protein
MNAQMVLKKRLRYVRCGVLSKNESKEKSPQGICLLSLTKAFSLNAATSEVI